MKGELMKNGLEQAYEMVLENAKEGTVKTNMKIGAAAAGELKQSKEGGAKNANAKKPVEAEQKLNPGYGKVKTESSEKELSAMLPTSKFDTMFKKQIVEEDGKMEGDESPLEMTGDEEFDDEHGDFPAEGSDDVAEEVDVATELRMVIDRLTEIAEKLGAFDEGMDEAGEETGEASAEDQEELAPESVQAKLSPMKNSTKTMQSKKFVVKSAFKATGKKAAAGGPGKGAADGKLSPARKTTLGPKMSMKADAKGTTTKPGAGIFDNI